MNIEHSVSNYEVGATDSIENNIFDAMKNIERNISDLTAIDTIRHVAIYGSVASVAAISIVPALFAVITGVSVLGLWVGSSIARKKRDSLVESVNYIKRNAHTLGGNSIPSDTKLDSYISTANRIAIGG